LAKCNVGVEMWDGLGDLPLMVEWPNPQQLWNDISGTTWTYEWWTKVPCEAQMDSKWELGFMSWTTPKNFVQEMVLKCLVELAEDDEVFFYCQSENKDLW